MYAFRSAEDRQYDWGWWSNIHIFVLTDLGNNGFQRKLIRQDMNI